MNKINIKKLLLNENYNGVKNAILEEFDNALKNNKTIKEVIEMTRKYSKINSMSRFISSLSESDSKDDELDDVVAEEIKDEIDDVEVDDTDECVEGLRRVKRAIAKSHNARLIRECSRIIEETEVDDPEDVKESLKSILYKVSILSENNIDPDGMPIDDGEDIKDNDVVESIRKLNHAIHICEETDDEDEDEIKENFSKADRIVSSIIPNIRKYPTAKAILEEETDKEVDNKDDIKEACVSYIKSLKRAKAILEEETDKEVDDDEYRDENGDIIEKCHEGYRSRRSSNTSELKECLTSTLSKFL